MSSIQAQIQVISRSDYTEQHLVNIPLPSSPLAPSAARVRPSVLSLIVNTLSCASHPEIKIGWWDVHPLPSSIPAPLSDASKYGRIGVWGWAEVLETTLNSVPAGARIYGFFPIATLPLDLQLESTDVPGIYRETSPNRAEALPMYNTYEVHAADAIGDKDSQAMDALAKPTFHVGFLFTRYTFNPTRCVHPSGAGSVWTPADADLTESIVVLVAATSKTALSLAYMLKRSDQETKPARVVALTSSASAPFAMATGWYSDVVTYDEVERVTQLGTGGRKVVIIDFGGRENAAVRLRSAVKDDAATVQFMVVGGEQKKDSMKFTPEVVSSLVQDGTIIVNAPAMIESAKAVLGKAGEVELAAEYNEVWNEFKKHGFPGMKIARRTGLQEYTKMYDRMCKGQIKPDTSFVFEM